VLVLEMHRLISLDTSVQVALVQLHRTLMRRGRGRGQVLVLVLAKVNEQPLSLIRRGGFGSELGADHIVPTVAAASDHMPLDVPAAPA
jgi:SulP family sulfate permease